MRRLIHGVRLFGVFVFVFGVASVAAAQQLLPLQFPDTDRTSVTDCSTPTILNLPDGTTVTLRGGQFVHYEDENFYGTMYLTSLYSAYRACNAPDFATDPDFADSAAYQSQMIDAFNWYNHGNADRNVDYGDKAWSFSQQFSPAHPLSKIFP